MRVCLFTDTLGDINGVSRFIRNIAEQALRRGLSLEVITSTPFECPDRPNIHNLPPRWSRPMPGYPQLQAVVPAGRDIRRLADRLKPDVVHVSTPGPVGLVGRSWARRRGVRMLGTYHTDFPAYIEHLFDDAALTWACRRTMAWFYRPFARLFTRSADYAAALQRLGYAPERVVRLLPGIDTAAFHVKHRDETGRVWQGCAGVRAESVKALYVGRVSVEKNLPMLASIWGRIASGCRERGVDAQLLVVGDGPYLQKMRSEITAAAPADSVCLLGFRHGEELSRIYAGSDLFVFPSTTDTLGQVVMEAQSAGLPVVVTDRGGPSEVVDDGRTGLVLPAQASTRWIAEIVALMADAPRRAAMGMAAHAKIQPMSIDKSFEHFWSVHESVAGGP